MKVKVTTTDPDSYPIRIKCICGLAYDGPRWQLLQCPQCSHIWNLYPTQPTPKYAMMGIPATIRTAQELEAIVAASPNIEKKVSIPESEWELFTECKMHTIHLSRFIETVSEAKALYEAYIANELKSAKTLDEVKKELDAIDDMETHK